MNNQQSTESSTAAPGPAKKTEKTASKNTSSTKSQSKAIEYGGQKGPDPTRYGDWEKAGRCTDF